MHADRLVPLPGPRWGPAPQRRDADAPRPAAAAIAALPWAGRAIAARRCRRIAADAARAAEAARPLAPAAFDEQAREAARRLRREGFTPAALAPALGLAAAAAGRALGRRPFETQVFAAAVLLQNHFAEMATGEGKTLATALAAATAALAGVPVHVVTANDYLARRDAAALAPLFAAFGRRSAWLPPDGDAAARAEAGRADVVYATARTLAFDDLRERLQRPGAGGPQDHADALCGRPAGPGRGLCMALLDEADSILLDEADVPLVLSRAAPQAARRAFLWQALALARRLQAPRDFVVQPAERQARLTPAGEALCEALAAPLGGPWRHARWRREVLHTALAALHLQQRDAHYLVRDGRLELLDEITGRVADGRVWSRGLHALVELKEGLAPGGETETVARTTFQRFFARYWRLAGTSGTLWEARAELREVYGAGVLRVPLRQPSRRIDHPERRFGSRERLHDAVAGRTAALVAQGRPVLIGTDSVADSAALSARLAAAGIAHRVLDALHDADEAEVVATAGRAGAVTVATRLAGRGTDIALDDAARAAGGLHVINTQDNPSQRLDRQLIGRCARQGDPGSAEAWWTPRRSSSDPRGLGNILSACVRGPIDEEHTWPPAAWRRWLRAWPQQREERRRRALRSALRHEDLAAERRLRFAGPAR